MRFLTVFLYNTFLVIGTSFAQPAGGLGPVSESVGDSRFDGHPLVEHFLDSIPSQRFHSDERLEQYTLNDHLPQSLNALQPTYSLLNLLGPTELNPSEIWSTVSSIRDGYHFPYEGNVLQPGAWPLQHHESYSKESQTIQRTGQQECPPNFGIYAQSPHNLSPDEYPHADVSSLRHSSDHLTNSHICNFETHRSNLARPEGSYNGHHLAPGLMDESYTPTTLLTEGFKSPNSFRGEPLLKHSANPSQYLPNPKQLTSLSSPPDPGTAMEAAWRPDMDLGSVLSMSQYSHLMSRLEPAANSDTTNYARALSYSKYSNSIPNISRGVARPPAGSIADASHTLLDRSENWIVKRKWPMIDLSEKRKRTREASIAKANREEDSFLKSRLAMGDRIENREHLVNPVPNRPSGLSTFKPEPTLSAELKKKEKLQNVLHHTTPAGSLDEDSLDYFFVISTLQFPNHRNYRNDLDGLENIFFDNFKPLGWPPKLEGKAQSSTTGWIDAIGLDATWHSLLVEICRRNEAFLWIFTTPESRDLRSTEQKKFSEWLTKQSGFDSQTTNSAKHEELPIKTLLSNYLEGMTMTGRVPPTEWVSDPTTPKSHQKLTRSQEMWGMRTKCALHILANYYQSNNFPKWFDLFTDVESFVRLFANLKVTERYSQFSKYAARKENAEKLHLFPWEDERRYEPEDIANIKKKGMILGSRARNIDNFVQKQKSGIRID